MTNKLNKSKIIRVTKICINASLGSVIGYMITLFIIKTTGYNGFFAGLPILICSLLFLITTDIVLECN